VTPCAVGRCGFEPVDDLALVVHLSEAALGFVEVARHDDDVVDLVATLGANVEPVLDHIRLALLKANGRWETEAESNPIVRGLKASVVAIAAGHNM